MPRIGPGTHERIGAKVLAAAEIADTRLITRRLSAFATAHRRYMAAQRKVEAAERLLRAAQVHLAQRDVAQDAAVDMLSRALVADGQPRKNPFKGLGVASPAVLVRLAVAKEAKLISRLVAMLQHREGLSSATRQAVRAAEKAARGVEATLTLLGKQQATLRELRQSRDAIGTAWKTALGALKRGARAAADDGAPQLHPTLFGRLGKRTGKDRRAKPASVAATTIAIPS